ncbi:MAG: GPR endopeptidase, partial [Clostridia bacterium]|nr:GPR endopeptidase [Clostridia bacterium]
KTEIKSTAAARHIGKPIGTYINIDTMDCRPRNITKTLREALKSLIFEPTKILIVGLGNDKFVADSLGPCVLQLIKTGEHLLTFEPSVFGVTGINSVDAIKAITRLVQPTTVFVIDSLVSATPARIGTNYQLCTSGITPGSGIGRNNQTINQKLLGVPVIAIGVPMCTIMTTTPNQIYHAVPKDIDIVIRDCAQIIAQSINTLV